MDKLVGENYQRFVNLKCTLFVYVFLFGHLFESSLGYEILICTFMGRKGKGREFGVKR